jgi:hypothetical protein
MKCKSPHPIWVYNQITGYVKAFIVECSKSNKPPITAILVIVLLSDFWSMSVFNIHYYIAAKTLFPLILVIYFFQRPNFLLNAVPLMVCRNICERLGCKPSFEYDQYIDGKKYCRRCETYFCHYGLFCPCTHSMRERIFLQAACQALY